MGGRKTIWEQLVEKKEDFIGKRLQDFGDAMDNAMGMVPDDGPPTTLITDLSFKMFESADGKPYAVFTVDGEDFSCSGNTKYLGVGGGEKGWLTLSGYGGYKWRFEVKSQEGKR